jgi:AcrR family transcriptional regulator
MTDAESPPASRREVGKAERRRRIIEAAGALLREAGLDAVSMTQIAERAGVSPATLYNLFQTKSAIFRHVFDLDLEAFQRLLMEAPARDALERIFVAIELAASVYLRDPTFYRAMARAGGNDAERLSSAIREPRIAFWRAQVAAAIAEGRLRPDTDADLLGVTLSQLMRGVSLEWAAHVISAERLAKEAAYGFALAVLAYATDQTAPSLKARIRDLQAALAGQARHERRT